MAPLVSRTRREGIAGAVFLISLSIIAFTGTWWPGISLALAASASCRQILAGRVYDAFVSVFIFGGIFVLATVKFDWNIILPVLFITAGIHIVIREYFVPRPRSEVDREEDRQHEIEEEQHPD